MTEVSLPTRTVRTLKKHGAGIGFVKCGGLRIEALDTINALALIADEQARTARRRRPRMRRSPRLRSRRPSTDPLDACQVWGKTACFPRGAKDPLRGHRKCLRGHRLGPSAGELRGRLCDAGLPCFGGAAWMSVLSLAARAVLSRPLDRMFPGLSQYRSLGQETLRRANDAVSAAA